MNTVSHQLDLKWDFSFGDLYAREGLVRLDGEFTRYLKSADVALFNRLMEARANPEPLSRKQHADLIVDLAAPVEDFIGELFGIGAEIRALQARHNALEPWFAIKRKFIQKKAISGVTPEQASLLDGPALAAELGALFGEPVTEESFVRNVSRWMESEADHVDALRVAAQY